MSTNDQSTSADLYQTRHEFILRNAPHKDVTQLAKDFFEAFNLSTKTTALDALHASLMATENSEIVEKLRTKDFKEWATLYFEQAKKQKKLSIQNLVEKERNKLKIAGVLKGSGFIKSGMDLLTSEVLVEQGEAVTHIDTTLDNTLSDVRADSENIKKTSSTKSAPASTISISTPQPANTTSCSINPPPTSKSIELSATTRESSSFSLLKRTLDQNHNSPNRRANKELMRVTDPWHDLIQAAICLYFGKNIEIPIVITSLETNSDKLYKLSIFHLRRAKETPTTTAFERSRNIDYKDAFGEQGCAAAALSKSQMAAVFDTATTPRKCDCILGIDGLQVGNFEAKRASTCKLDISIMLRKNMKISKSILLSLKKYNVGCPPLLNICGPSALVFKIMEYEDIWIFGKAYDSIVLPTTIPDNFLEDYHNYAKEVLEAKEIYDYRKKAQDQEDFVTLFDPPVSQTLDWENVVLHSPSKRQQSKSNLKDVRVYPRKLPMYLEQDWDDNGNNYQIENGFDDIDNRYDLDAYDDQEYNSEE
ncbi:hypothetical protein BGZ46_001264 [Entomortierella lignicola]|nr:hypothetical protein BGZ46_001264 [Entomortierella lignicola]